MTSGPEPIRVVYEYAPGRSGEHGETLLKGFRGTVQVDGRPQPAGRTGRGDAGGVLGPCKAWPGDGVREQRLTAPRRGWTASRSSMPSRRRSGPPATRQFVRWTEPLVNAFGLWLAEQRSCVSPKSRREAHLYRQPVGCWSSSTTGASRWIATSSKIVSGR